MAASTSSEWWRSLTAEAKRHYIKDHPNSKYAKKTKNNARIKKYFDKASSGSLHEHMHVPKGKKLPISRLRKVANSNSELAGRARLALSLQGYKLGRRKKKTTKKRRVKR